ncbi:MAG: VWA domain-containing protein, partial [Chloroflexota bacterium]
WKIVGVTAFGLPGFVIARTIFQPSVSHWLALANYNSGRELFDLSNSPATANAPVVISIWESRLQAIRNTVGYDDIGWEELLDVLNSPNGWADYGISGRQTVYYGHTDPFISSTALSTLIAEFYASARADGFTGRRLTMDIVQDEDVVQGVRDIEELIRHYSQRTTEFRNYIAQGPDYLDFVALEENDLIAINRGLTDFGTPPERLVALYPKEGTFWHEHPFGIPNASWVSEEQRQAARTFADYVVMPEQQQIIMSYGFRPVNPAVELAFPFEEQYGVTREGPATVLDVPEPAVIDAIQDSWDFVKKQADIMLLIDTSGSMEDDDKLKQAIAAALAFLDETEPSNRVGLATFDDTFQVRVELDVLEINRSALEDTLNSLTAGGRTTLYDAIADTVDIMNESDAENRIRAVVLLSDGEDTCEAGGTDCLSLEGAIEAIESTESSRNPVIVVPVGYGDISTDLERVLDDIADASNTIWIPGNPDNIESLLQLISSFF